MIEFTNVSKKYANGVIGLHNINIQIEPGEFLFVIGPSGAGKSSFLKMINLMIHYLKLNIIFNFFYFSSLVV